jgi:hypothetical protein
VPETFRGRLNFGSAPFRYSANCLPASSRTFEDPKEVTFLQSSTEVIFSASAVRVMKPKGEGNDLLEIASSLMSQLLSVFGRVKQDLKVVEKLNPKTRWVLG